MSDKSVLCLRCGSYVPSDERVGGPGEPYTFHRICAREEREELERLVYTDNRDLDHDAQVLYDWLR